jgi:tyrosyl-tRNA synthetase
VRENQGGFQVESIEKQVTTYMQGAEFGDAQIKEMMTAELRQKLTEAKAEGRPLRVYCGYDVTAPDIHLGHMAILRKMRKFQDFGHDVTFLIGTFTTLIGDPSDRDEARAEALQEEVKKNAQTYADQALKILDPKKTKVRYNYEWLSKLTFADVISMASFFTVQQFLVRDRLRNRYEKNDPIWLRELLYPLAQGYDAVFLRADVQLGGTEQLFNLMAGRKLQEAFGQKPQVCLTYPVLVGTDGVQRMSKSTGNYIGINEPPEDIYGKTMSISDDNIMIYFESLTDTSAEKLKDMRNQLTHNQVNPMDLKKRLAKDIVTQLYNEKEAREAEEHFEKVVQKKELPDEIREYRTSLIKLATAEELSAAPGYFNVDISRLLVETGLVNSRSEANRIIYQGGTVIDGEVVTNRIAAIQSGTVIKVGKHRFIKVINTD